MAIGQGEGCVGVNILYCGWPDRARAFARALCMHNSAGVSKGCTKQPIFLPGPKETDKSTSSFDNLQLSFGCICNNTVRLFNIDKRRQQLTSRPKISTGN